MIIDKERIKKVRISLKYLGLFCLFLSAPAVFAAVPIQDTNLNGAAAAEARWKLLLTAESFLGTPYRYAGIDRKGLDCSGLVFLSFRESLNYTIPRSSEGIYNWTEKIRTEDLQPGDLVFFVTTGQRVSHLGIYAGEGRFIHSASEGPQTGVIYSRLEESYWKRTYIGAGRALPWDKNTAEAMTAARNSRPGAPQAGAAAGPRPPAVNPVPARTGSSGPTWDDSGFFTGFGAAWDWGAFFEGAPSAFRGLSGLAMIGYKWSDYQAGLEFRVEWDRALGVFRVPFTFSLGSETFRLFGGPAYTFGEAALSLSDGERHYTGGGAWLWEAGLFAAFPPMKMDRGALSFYGDLAWKPYHWAEGEEFRPKPDITANVRASTGIRYSYKL
jgi:probable lipoprotein NlpC